MNEIIVPLLPKVEHPPALDDIQAVRSTIKNMVNFPLIIDAMKKTGLTNAALAAACGVSELAVERWLKSESIPRPGKLKKLSEVLEIRVELLLTIACAIGPLGHDAPEHRH